MSNLDTSKAEILNQNNLPFYLNDFDDEQAPASFICFRITGKLEYNNIISADFSHTEQQLNDQFDKISNDIQNLGLFIKSSNLILSNQSNVQSPNSSAKTCENIYENYHKQKFNADAQSTSLENLVKFVPVELLKTVSVPDEKNGQFSPVFTNHKGICRLQPYHIPIDCLVFVNPNLKLDRLHEILFEKLSLHLQTIKQCFITYFQNEANFEPQTYHYLVGNQSSTGNSANLIVTCVYPSNHIDDQLALLRSEIHKTLELPTDKPLLRRVDAFQFENVNQADADSLYSNYLKNPHVHAKPSDIKNGKQSLVQGNYIYFHYMQNNFNDNGWGCAYRSFQTIFSWFKLQAYTQKQIPSHRQIQQALVDMGDKPKEFVGSSKWIGSMEISFCLSNMLNVDCKIIAVSRGSEIADKARELQYHFETEGTPIMIGGGVLAHTIIGIDFNEMTGDVRYLILDPHYTGSEDIKTITGKGWVGWKDSKFWNENTFYNMCCPIRPKGV